NWTGASGYMGIGLVEISGCPMSPVDSVGVAGYGFSTPCTSSITTANAKDIVIGTFYSNVGGVTADKTAINGSGTPWMMEYMTETSTGTYSMAPVNAGSNWVSYLAAFKGVSASSGLVGWCTTQAANTGALTETNKLAGTLQGKAANGGILFKPTIALAQSVVSNSAAAATISKAYGSNNSTGNL